MVMERDFIWSGDQTIQGTNDLLWNYALEICIILLTNVITINPSKKMQREREINELNTLEGIPSRKMRIILTIN